MLVGVKAFFEKHLNFSGRADRGEFNIYYFVGWVVFAACVVLCAIDFYLTTFLLSGAYSVILAAAYVRRLHDLGRSGGCFFLLFFPFVGSLVGFACSFHAGDEGENEFGPPPGPAYRHRDFQ